MWLYDDTWNNSIPRFSPPSYRPGEIRAQSWSPIASILIVLHDLMFSFHTMQPLLRPSNDFGLHILQETFQQVLLKNCYLSCTFSVKITNNNVTVVFGPINQQCTSELTILPIIICSVAWNERRTLQGKRASCLAHLYVLAWSCGFQWLTRVTRVSVHIGTLDCVGL
jgi:hypothetical protein